jgi:hypothetical protein
MRGDQLNAALGQTCIERITIVSFFLDQMRWSSIDKTLGESGFNKGDFMRRSTRNMNGDRKASTVCHGHGLHTFAPLGLSSTSPPSFATTKVPSMKHSETSSPPRSRRSVASACRMRSKTPERTHGWIWRWHVW